MEGRRRDYGRTGLEETDGATGRIGKSAVGFHQVVGTRECGLEGCGLGRLLLGAGYEGWSTWGNLGESCSWREEVGKEAESEAVPGEGRA